jgi:hypothetical protein
MSQVSVAGQEWFRDTHGAVDGNVCVSRSYPPSKSRAHQSTWAFEFPLRGLDPESAVSITYWVCQSENGGGFYCLRVPHRYVLDNLAALFLRGDRPSFSVWLAADPAARFTDVHGTGGLRFEQFLLP